MRFFGRNYSVFVVLGNFFYLGFFWVIISGAWAAIIIWGFFFLVNYYLAFWGAIIIFGVF